MEIKVAGVLYTIEVEARFTRLRLKSMPAFKICLGIFWLVAVAMTLYLLYGLWLGFAKTVLPLLLFFLGVVAFCIWIIATLPMRSARRSAKSQIAFREPVSAVITDESLRIDRPTNTVISKWTRFLAADRYENEVVLWIDDATYLPMPRKVFSNEGDWSEFVSFIKSKFTPRYTRPVH